MQDKNTLNVMNKKIRISKKNKPEIYFSIYTTVFYVVYPLIFHTSPISKYNIGAILIFSPVLGIPFGIMLGKIWKLAKSLNPQNIKDTIY